MTITVHHEQKEHFSTGKNVGEFISFESTGWWSDGPLSFSRENDQWSMGTSSGGQNRIDNEGNEIDVLDRISELRAMLDYAEKAIIEQRAKEVV